MPDAPAKTGCAFAGGRFGAAMVLAAASLITIAESGNPAADSIRSAKDSTVVELDRMVITAASYPQNRLDIGVPVNVVTAEEMVRRAASTIAEGLREEAGVCVQKTNHGGGSVNLRGLSSNQILILVDGVRLNNSTYRLGNHQYLSTIDNNLINHVEVVRGPLSLMYGSDALGGTINVITARPLKAPDSGIALHYRLLSHFASADFQKTLRSDLTLRSNRVTVHGGLSLKDYNDPVRGSRYGPPELVAVSSPQRRQSPNGFCGWDGDLKICILPTERDMVTIAAQSTSYKDVPRYDKYLYDGYLRWMYTPQQRRLLYCRFERAGADSRPVNLATTVSLHQQSEGREMQKRITDALSKDFFRVITGGWTGNAMVRLRSHTLLFGADAYADKVDSRKTLFDATSGTSTTDPATIFPDGARYLNAGIFLRDHLSLTPRLRLNAGLRYNAVHTGFTLQESIRPVLGDDRYSDYIHAVTGAGGIVFMLTPTAALSCNIGQGFRAPNLADIAKFGESKGSIFEIPNTKLKPEKLTSFDAGWKIDNNRISASASVYFAHLRDLIASADATFQNRSTITVNNEEYSIKSKQNTGVGIVTGVEGDFDCLIVNSLRLRSNATFCYGRNMTANEPIGGIPPLFGLLSLSWEQSNRYAEVYTRFAGPQYRLSADDADDPRIPHGGTPGWYTLNMRFGARPIPEVGIHAGLENLLDYNYREHGSGINGAGRNFTLSMDFKI